MKKTMAITIALLLWTSLSHAQDNLFILGGELSNSAATSVADIDEVMPRMRQLGLNTVLVPAYWEMLEPEEGHYDFTLIDRTVVQARKQGLKVVFLWFGAWKNSMSCYAPLWFKQDVKRFPRARTAEGKPLEIASCFSEDVFQADNRAFGMLMQHISKTAQDVVSMVQVENEIGMLESARDHSMLAEAVYNKGVPTELMDYLKKNKKTLHPWLKERMAHHSASPKNRPTWASVFGSDIFTDEIFMAYYYAKYVGRLCETARQYTQIPLYVNAAMNSRGRQPGQYPSAGPLAHLIDLWHAGAPQLLCLAPDIYDTGFKSWADQYALPNNRLFIPESRCCENSGVRALYAFGEHQALGFSPFAIDQATTRETESVTKAYALLRQIANCKSVNSKLADSQPVKGKSLNSKSQWGLLFDQQDKERIIHVSQDWTTITCRHYFTLPWDPRATDGSTWPEGGAVLIRMDKNEYLLAGSGVVVSFATDYEKSREEQKVLGEDGFVESAPAGGNNTISTTAQRPAPSFRGPRLGIGSVDEVSIDAEGRLQYLRRHNGDQDHQGRHARIGCGEWKILHIRLYEYE